ncbi:MAG TPA: hypothetical protein VMJ10_10085 [Kofleriaceae bacterium]|nr:hypothetical protein [Kofleriaceae bacterium]
METVKVDIQKLQLLNDRIAQTIEALNQVRMSVHGIQHTSAALGAQVPVPTLGGYGYSPFGPYSQLAFGQPTYGQPNFGQPFSPFVQGLSHTTNPWTTNPYTTNAFTANPYTGIAHTSWDPMWQVRAAQTFPFAQVQVPFVY